MNTERNFRHPLRREVFVDVDGTLIRNGDLNHNMVQWIRDQSDVSFILWSAAGRSHAEEVARCHGIEDLFSLIISKPSYIIDDVGWRWIHYTLIIDHSKLNDFEFSC